MRTFESWMVAHKAVPVAKVVEQLRAIPVGRSGVAGCAGSVWDPIACSSRRGGAAKGPGVVVKRSGEDEYLVGCVRPTLTAQMAAEKIVGLCSHNL